MLDQLYKIGKFNDMTLCDYTFILTIEKKKVNRVSYMRAHVLLNLLNELEKAIKCEDCRAFYLYYATSLIN